MSLRLAISLFFMSKAMANEYQVANQPMLMVNGAGIVNPKPTECYQIYQAPAQAPICATVAQPVIATTGVINSQRIDSSGRLSNDLVRLISSIPSAREKLSSFLEYNGITQPWSEIFDFNSDKQHTMPAPEPMFSKIQLLLDGLESIKEFISNELFKIEKYVRRGKAYLAENFDDLKRYHSLLKEYLRKMKAAKSVKARNEYAEKFSALRGKTEEKIKSYLSLKKWLETTVRLFGALM